MFIRVVDADPKWKSMFVSEAGKIREILGNELITVFHIGSTAVEGLKAKPIIDIMPVVENIHQLDAYAFDFEVLGYEVMGEFGIPGRRYFRKGGDHRTHQIHAFQFDNLHEIERHLAVRNYLRAHPEIRTAYGALKSRLALEFPEDIEGYANGKEAFVAAMEKDALRWRYRRESENE